MNNLLTSELIDRCHSASRANGWWDKAPNPGQQLMLVISELSEALEADRNNRRAKLDAYQEAMTERIAQWQGPNKPKEGEPCKPIFEAFIKDTVEDELADAYIRLCDYSGGHKVPAKDIAAHIERWKDGPHYHELTGCFGADLVPAVVSVVEIDNRAGEQAVPRLSEAFRTLERIASLYKIDLGTHIDLKLSYNTTRGKMHGGKAY